MKKNLNHEVDMQLELFPRPRNLAMGVGLGVAFGFIGRNFMTIANEPGLGNPGFFTIVGAAALLGGLLIATSCAWHLFRPSPSFVADEDGFSVMGKRKQPWEKFQGVNIRQLHTSAFMPSVKWVIVRSGKSKTFSRKLHIKWTHLSDPAEQMAERILAFGNAQQSASQAQQHATPMAPLRPRSKPMPVSRPAPSPSFADGPIQSAPSMRKRLFGG